MDKILKFLQASSAKPSCTKAIGWLKLISCIVIAIFMVLVLIFFSSIAETIKKNINSSSNTKFYLLLALLMIFLIIYAACSFVLIIGTINHDIKLVSIFIASDVVFTLMVLYGFIELFPSTFFIVLLILQIMSFYCVVQWMRTLIQEYNKRRENEETRRRAEHAKESFENEIKQYHAKLKVEEEV